jgi:protein O-GlcNAc transferase
VSQPLVKDVRLSPAEAEILVAQRCAAKRLPAAEALCQAWLSIEPAASEALRFLGIICLESGRKQEALEFLERARDLSPANGDTRRNLGDAVLRLGRPAEAVTHFEAALEIEPRDAAAARSLGLCLRALGRRDEALAAFQRALAIRPEFAKAAYNLGLIQQELGQLTAAESSLRRAVELAPDVALHHAALAGLLAVRDKLGEASAAAPAGTPGNGTTPIDRREE